MRDLGSGCAVSSEGVTDLSVVALTSRPIHDVDQRGRADRQRSKTALIGHRAPDYGGDHADHSSPFRHATDTAAPVPTGVTTTLPRVDLEAVGEYAEALAGCKRKGTRSRPAWYVHDRLVARLTEPGTLLVRVPMSGREALIRDFPNTFGVPPRMESHHKVEAYLDNGDSDGIRAAIRLAWDMQRRP